MPLSVYDFFAYVAAGLAVAASVDFAWDGRVGLQETAGASELVPLLAGAYVVGHVCASAGRALLESFLLKRVLRRPPATALIDDRQETGPFLRAFGTYFRPLPATTLARVRDRAAIAGLEPAADGFMQHARVHAARDQSTSARLERFDALFAFCRNTSVAGLVASVVLLTGGLVDADGDRLRAAAVAVVAAR